MKLQRDKTDQKRQLLVDRTAAALRLPPDVAARLLGVSRRQSLRLNPLKSHADTIEQLEALGWVGRPFLWFGHGLTIDSGLEAIRDGDLVANGEVYIQNAASWLPVLALDPQAGDEVLDVCAAPGGKTSHIAAHADNMAHITANDNSRPRLAKMRANLERMGVQNVEYTLYDASQLARKLAGRQYDKILLDAPCSGEGMMNYDNDKDFATWSVAHIKRLQQLQKRLITQTWELLKPGGTLVYSTCTMAPEENEAVIDYLIRRHEDVQIVPIAIDLPNRVSAVSQWNDRQFNSTIQHALRLQPSEHIEAFFVCKLVKTL